MVNPAGAGTSSGDGVFPNGSTITVNAAAITSTLPYYFASWTENGVFESGSTNCSFMVSRSRTLTANFTLPTYQISAVNNPPAAGSVSGQGTFFYGTTNVLTANANYGYRFTSWTENGNLLATTAAFTNIVTSNRVVVANYAEANTLHFVTTATSPTNLATVTGAGNYTNGQMLNLSAPASVTLSPYIYTFHEFRVNGSLAGNSPTISRTLSTLDPTNLDYVAGYDSKSILPFVVGVTAGFTNAVQGGFTSVTNPVPATTNYRDARFSLTRSMDTNVTPLVIITNSVALVQPFVPTNGVWFATSVSNDTYRTPFITFSNGMDGPALLKVSRATDPLARQMAATNIAALVIDVDPAVESGDFAGRLEQFFRAGQRWTGYAPPADLGSFRLYLSTTNFSSIAGFSSRCPSAWGRCPEFRIHRTDARPAVLRHGGGRGYCRQQFADGDQTFLYPGQFPAATRSSAGGGAGFIVRRGDMEQLQLQSTAGFCPGSSFIMKPTTLRPVAGLTPKATLVAGINSMEIDNLDRTRTYHFAVVGYNVHNAFNPTVTTASWSDPYAGNISVNTTLGGSGQKIVRYSPEHHRGEQRYLDCSRGHDFAVCSRHRIDDSAGGLVCLGHFAGSGHVHLGE